MLTRREHAKLQSRKVIFFVQQMKTAKLEMIVQLQANFIDYLRRH